MASDVLMPQMGESIAEGTIVRWIKKVGDNVDRDEPLFEISTDKVDAEIPSPAAGVLTQILAREGETVPVNSVVAIISPPGSKVAPSAPAPTAAPALIAAAAPSPAPVSPVAAPASESPSVSGDERLRQRSSPLVRKIAQEHKIDITELHGTGIAGRVTKQDILSYIAAPSRASAPPSHATPSDLPSTPHATAGQGAGQAAATGAGLAGQTVALSVMRRKIADHMVMSKRTSAHVHTVFEVNFSRIDQIRKAKKAEYEARGGKLTYLSFIVKAAAAALRTFPIMNASLDANGNVTYHRPVNIGVAVSLDWGLIVPVLKGADEKDLLGVSKAIADLADRARAKQLKPDEVAGGTFTVTNPGGIGAQFGLPIINQPQVGILGVGAIEKRAVVVDDAIGIRLMGYLSLAFDHRVVDGAVGDRFMALVKHQLENWNPSQA